MGFKGLSIYYSVWADRRCRMASCMAYKPLTQQNTPCHRNHSEYIAESGMYIWPSECILQLTVKLICLKLVNMHRKAKNLSVLHWKGQFSLGLTIGARYTVLSTGSKLAAHWHHGQAPAASWFQVDASKKYFVMDPTLPGLQRCFGDAFVA